MRSAARSSPASFAGAITVAERPRIRAVMADDNVCVMGSEAKIREAKDLFTSLISLPD